MREDSISVFKSQLTAIASKRRAIEKGKHERDRVLIDSLNSNIDINMDPEIIRSARLVAKKKLFVLDDMNRLMT